MKKAMIIGASSGIGKALAKQLSAGGVEVGLAARRYELLAKLRDELLDLHTLKRSIQPTANARLYC
ncbi:SDR family NAD(P)-dependent oxidoreductase [Bacillus paralicheniformis]|nr:SDR family NAD(P)-dependent oxidoreductase [Bacillus paralicheniformis]